MQSCIEGDIGSRAKPGTSARRALEPHDVRVRAFWAGRVANRLGLRMMSRLKCEGRGGSLSAAEGELARPDGSGWCTEGAHASA
eukprot:7505964-Pyramimonas_sp.AAC.1